MKTVSLLSGGKDSFLSAIIASEQGCSVDLAITVIPEEFSMMYHYPNAEMARLVAGLLGTDWKPVREDELAATLANLASDGYSTMVSGAIASEYQKTRLEKLCTETGLRSYTPLWHKDQGIILRELLLRGIGSIIVSVSAEGFTEEDLGREIDQSYITELERRNARYGINLAGEGGEYESFVRSFGTRAIVIESAHKVWEGSHGYFIIDRARLS